MRALGFARGRIRDKSDADIDLEHDAHTWSYKARGAVDGQSYQRSDATNVDECLAFVNGHAIRLVLYPVISGKTPELTLRRMIAKDEVEKGLVTSKENVAYYSGIRDWVYTDVRVKEGRRGQLVVYLRGKTSVVQIASKNTGAENVGEVS